MKDVSPSYYESAVIRGEEFFFHKGDEWWKKNIEVWRRLHKREFLIKNELYFEENVDFEDFIYSIKLLVIFFW